MSFWASNLLEVIEVSTYTRILEVLVANGYAPDIRDTTAFPDNQAGMHAYKSAKEAIIADKGFCIDLFNMSNPDYKGNKDLPRIVLIFDDPIPGEIGGFGGVQYMPGAPYTPIQQSPNLSDIPFGVYLVSLNAKQRRVLIGAISVALPTKGYIELVDHLGFGTGLNVFVEMSATATIPGAKDGVLERVYRYTFKDLLMTDIVKVLPDVSPLEEIKVYYEFKKRIEMFTITP